MLRLEGRVYLKTYPSVKGRIVRLGNVVSQVMWDTGYSKPQATQNADLVPDDRAVSIIPMTLRQVEVLAHLKECGVIRTGYDGSVLESLRKKRLVIQHSNAGGGSSIYYTWTLSQEGRNRLQHSVTVR